MPYEITHYLPRGRGDFPAFTPAEAGNNNNNNNNTTIYMAP